METDDHDRDGSTQNQNLQKEGEDDDQTPSRTSAPISNIRSYECTFCKRGFSNAQALGGHMNIHRKHKAKLKQSSSTSSSSPKDITPHQPHQQLQPISNLETFYSPPTPTTNPSYSWPWNAQQHDRDQTNPTESPSHKDDQTGQQLDLELRLGPEPNRDSQAATTRKFF